ncbi:MAG TPA: DUF4157 domain-containing protein [Vicinamibacterales bacterium]
MRTPPRAKHSPARAARDGQRSVETGGPASDRPPRPGASARNQDALAAVGIRTAMPVSKPGDADEREADRAAEAFVSGRASPLDAASPPAPPSARIRRSCASCEEDAAPIRRKAASSIRPSGVRPRLAGSRGRLMTAEARAPYERFFNRDFSTVRVHDDAQAHAAASALNARAFAKGQNVYFGPGALDAATDDGRRLLAHELAHVAQEEHGAERIRRQENMSGAEPDPSQLVCRAETEPNMCVAPPTAGLPDAGTLDARVAAFKEWVKQAAVQRLMGNRTNLQQWAVLFEQRLPDSLIAAAGLSQSGGYRAYADLQDVHNPMTREILAYQAAGRYRACTGCHLMNEAWGWGATQPHTGPDWMSPNERRAGLAADWGVSGNFAASTSFFTARPSTASRGYTPPAGTAEGNLMSALPDPGRVLALMQQARPILQQLGPEGFKVLPQRLLDDLETRSMADVRRETIDTIQQRRSDYLELIGKIQAGDVSYDKFGPIIQDLLPLASPDVRGVIQAEMDSQARWKLVESIVIGILTIAALILIVFPPTTALGLMVAGAIDVSLATYGAITGPGMMETGHAYSLGTGANTVFSQAQQDAAGLMMLTGFLGTVLAPLGIIGGTARIMTGVGKLGTAVEATTALLQVGQTIQRGDYVVTMLEDGGIMATSTTRPDLMIIVRGETATLYQSMGPGGMRVIGSQSLAEMADVSEAVQGQSALTGARPTPLLTAGSAARTTADEYADFLRLLEEEGGGVPRSGEPVSLQPHRAAGQARQQLGVTGQTQSAHGLPQSIGRGIPGYDAEAALTILEARAIHRGMDGPWKQAFMAFRRSGRTTASGQEIYDAVAGSFRSAQGLPAGVGDTLAARLQDEMFVEFGLSPTAQYTLPYPNIHP